MRKADKMLALLILTVVIGSVTPYGLLGLLAMLILAVRSDGSDPSRGIAKPEEHKSELDSGYSLDMSLEYWHD